MRWSEDLDNLEQISDLFQEDRPLRRFRPKQHRWPVKPKQVTKAAKVPLPKVVKTELVKPEPWKAKAYNAKQIQQANDTARQLLADYDAGTYIPRTDADRIRLTRARRRLGAPPAKKGRPYEGDRPTTDRPMTSAERSARWYAKRRSMLQHESDKVRGEDLDVRNPKEPECSHPQGH